MLYHTTIINGKNKGNKEANEYNNLAAMGLMNLISGTVLSQTTCSVGRPVLFFANSHPLLTMLSYATFYYSSASAACLFPFSLGVSIFISFNHKE